MRHLGMVVVLMVRDMVVDMVVVVVVVVTAHTGDEIHLDITANAMEWCWILNACLTLQAAVACFARIANISLFPDRPGRKHAKV